MGNMAEAIREAIIIVNDPEVSARYLKYLGEKEEKKKRRIKK